jgi:hypothetical protein
LLCGLVGWYLFIRHTNDSNHVSKEVGLALERDKALLPVRVEDVMPTGSLQYLLQLVQWVDAFPGPMRDHLAQVRRSVASVVPAPAEISTATATTAAGAPTPPGNATVPGAPSPAAPAVPGPGTVPPPGPAASPPPGVTAQPELMPQRPQATWSPLGASVPAAPPPLIAPVPGVNQPPPPPVVAAGPGSPGRPWSSANQNQRTILGSVAILAVAVVAAALILGRGGSAAPEPSPSATSAALATPSVGPTATVAPTPTESPSLNPATVIPATPSPSFGPSTPAFPNAAELDLLHHVPEAIRSTCIKSDAPQVVTAAAVAVVDCYPHTTDAPNFVRYASFPTLQALDSVFNADVAFAAERASTSKLCSTDPFTGGNGPYTRGDTTVGQLICYLDGAAAWVGWTYEPDLIWAGASRGDGDAKSLYQWWSNSGGPI